jgi:ACR3 family arsenite transporter
LVEVPIMIGLVTVALWIKERYYKIEWMLVT